MINKKIGILTSGGDCGGLNAAIRSIFYRAKNKYNMDVFGIRDENSWINKNDQLMYYLPQNFWRLFVEAGGTFLGSTNKGNPFKIPTGAGKHVDKSKK